MNGNKHPTSSATAYPWIWAIVADIPRFEIPEIPLTKVQSCARPHSRRRCLANRRRPQKLVMKLSHYRNDEMIAIVATPFLSFAVRALQALWQQKKDTNLHWNFSSFSQSTPRGRSSQKKSASSPESSSHKNEDHNEQSETSNLHQSSCRGHSTFYLRYAIGDSAIAAKVLRKTATLRSSFASFSLAEFID